MIFKNGYFLRDVCLWKFMKKFLVIKICYELSYIYMYLNLYFVIILISGFFFIGELLNKNFYN